MTNREAFERQHLGKTVLQRVKYIAGAFHKDYVYTDAQTAWNAWQAACEYQKQKDADIALKVASSFGAPDAYWIFADTIRDQNEN